jgi:hypothetical protein
MDDDAYGGPLSLEAQSFLDALNVAEFFDLTLKTVSRTVK